MVFYINHYETNSFCFLQDGIFSRLSFCFSVRITGVGSSLQGDIEGRVVGITNMRAKCIIMPLPIISTYHKHQCNSINHLISNGNHITYIHMYQLQLVNH
ncbi:hypothetical protein Dimus_011088 [Dionaea muscipula]